MTTKKIYEPWIKWDGGECPVPLETKVEVKLRSGNVMGPRLAYRYRWKHIDSNGDIVEYRTFTEQPDLEAAEQLLRANDYTVIPPAKPLTFEDAVPMTAMPPKGTEFWVVSASTAEGVYRALGDDRGYASLVIKRRMAYLEKEHALIAARHIFGLKGGEL